MRMTLEQAVERYGQIDFERKVWPSERLWMGLLVIPEDLQIDTWVVAGTNTPVKKVYCNKDMAPAFLAALYHVRDRDLQHELKTYDGCFNVRTVRGTTDLLSTHCYGLAVDLNAKENPLGGPIKFSPEFVQCFTDAGFTWGGTFRRPDGQHFSWAWE